MKKLIFTLLLSSIVGLAMSQTTQYILENGLPRYKIQSFNLGTNIKIYDLKGNIFTPVYRVRYDNVLDKTRIYQNNDYLPTYELKKTPSIFKLNWNKKWE